MDDTGTAVYHWRAGHEKAWISEGGAFPVCVLVPLTVLLAFVAPGAAWLLGLGTAFAIAFWGRGWARTWRSLTEVRVETGARRRLLLRRRYGRTRAYPLDAVTAVRPLQVGQVFHVMVKPGEDDERTETDEMVLLLEVAGAAHTTYAAPGISEASVRPLVEELRRACPGAVVADTEYRMRSYVDVERGMSPG
ncbi:hypothetical protein SAVIM338S_01657 [Streptomyces avidinii]